MAAGTEIVRTSTISEAVRKADGAPPSETIKIIVFNDHPVFRSSLAWKMASGSGVRVVADAPGLYDTITLAADLAPNAVLADLRIGDGNSEGIESVSTLARSLGPIPIIVNSDFCSRANIEKLIKAGATAVVPKSAGAESLVTAIRDAVANSRSRVEARSHSAA